MHPIDILKDEWLKHIDFDNIDYSKKRGYPVKKLSRIHTVNIEETQVEEKLCYIISGTGQCIIRMLQDNIEENCSFELMCHVVFDTDESGVPVKIKNFEIRRNKIIIKGPTYYPCRFASSIWNRLF